MGYLLYSSCFPISACLFPFALSEAISIFTTPQPQLTTYSKNQGLWILLASTGWVRFYSWYNQLYGSRDQGHSIYMWWQKPTPEGGRKSLQKRDNRMTRHPKVVHHKEIQRNIDHAALRSSFYMSPHDRKMGMVWLRQDILFLYSHNPVLGILFFLRWRFLYSNCSQSYLPTTSPALKSSLHQILKYIILPIQICQGFYCICISNLIKSFSGWHFSLKATSNWIFFSLLSLSPFPVQLHFQIANHSISRERQGPTVAIFPSLVCGEVQLCISNSGLYLQQIFCKHLKISFLPVSHKLIIAFCQMLPLDASYHGPKEGEVNRYIHSWISGLYPSSMTSFLISFKPL